MTHESGGVTLAGTFSGAFTEWSLQFWRSQEFEVYDDARAVSKYTPSHINMLPPLGDIYSPGNDLNLSIFEDA